MKPSACFRACSFDIGFHPPRRANPPRRSVSECRFSLLIPGQKLQELSGAKRLDMKMTTMEIKGRPLRHSRVDWLVLRSFPPHGRMLANCFGGLFHTALSQDDFLDYTSAKSRLFKTPGIHSIASTLISLRCQLMGMCHVAMAPHNSCQEPLTVCGTLCSPVS